MRNTDEFFQFAQIKVTLRLLRDDETIDKELLAYADQVVSLQFNKMLRSAVPSLEKVKQRVGEILSITTDDLLLALKKGRYFLKFNNIVIPIEDLFYTRNQEDGYTLSYSESQSGFNVLTARKEGEKRTYTIECPKCDMARGASLIQKKGDLEAIACGSCGRVVIERVTSMTLKRKVEQQRRRESCSVQYT